MTVADLLSELQRLVAAYPSVADHTVAVEGYDVDAAALADSYGAVEMRAPELESVLAAAEGVWG
jgi:hypothetical protein